VIKELLALGHIKAHPASSMIALSDFGDCGRATKIEERRAADFTEPNTKGYSMSKVVVSLSRSAGAQEKRWRLTK
jgi:hypothetical protein